MKVDPITLKYLLESMNEGVRDMHVVLRAPLTGQTINALARIAHKLRGEATVVGLANLSQLIIAMENAIDRLGLQRELKKSDLQGIGIHLLKIVKVCEHIRKSAVPLRQTSSQVGGRQPAMRAQITTRAAGIVAALQVLATNVARSYGKRVSLNLEKFDIGEVPASMQIKVQDIVIQLLRNAIAHGIEVPSLRENLGKTPSGTVAIVTRRTNNQLLIAVRDNGQGIDLEDIRRKLVINFRYGVVDAAKMTREALLKSLFLPGFSTVEEQQQHAGRGVGLDLVKEHAYSLGGSVDVSFKANQYAQFVIRIPLEKSIANNVADLRSARRKQDKKARIVVPTLTDIAHI